MFKLIGALVVYGFATYGLMAWWKQTHEKKGDQTFQDGHERRA